MVAVLVVDFMEVVVAAMAVSWVEGVVIFVPVVSVVLILFAVVEGSMPAHLPDTCQLSRATPACSSA